MADPQKKSRLQGDWTSSLYDAGASARGAFGDTLGQMGRGALVASAPYVLPAAAASQVLQGFAGGERQSNADFSGVSTRALPGPLSTAAAAPALSASPAPGTATPALRPGDVNTFTGSNGITQSVPFAAAASAPNMSGQPALRAPLPVVAPRSNATAVQDATERALGGTRSAALTARQDATELLNPMSGGGELMRRFEISQGGFKGSPSARRMAGEAILGQLGAQNDASATGQAGANQVLQQGAQNEGVAGENYSARRLDADQFNVESGLRHSESLERMQRPIGDPIRDVNGQTSILRGDGSTSLLRDEAGAAIRTPGAQDQADVLSLKDLLNSYNEQATAISADPTATPAEKVAQITALKQDPLYSSRLFGQGGAAPAPGTVKGGYRFKGGDPANQASWEKVN